MKVSHLSVSHVFSDAVLNKDLFCQDIRSFFGGASKAATKAPEATKGDMHLLHIGAHVNDAKA